MVVKLNNKDSNFYMYMGKIFGSRLIERQTNDRIYDDNEKEWYVAIEEEKVVAFVSLSHQMIKNIYTTKEKYLEEILKVIKEKVKIKPSIVTNIYKEIYQKMGYSLEKENNYKNFVVIYNKE